MWIRTADIVLCGEESIEVNLRNELIATFSFMKIVIVELAKSLPSHGLPPPLTSHRLGACRCASPNRSGCRSMSRCAVRPLLHLLHLRLLLHRRYSRAGGALRRPKRVPPRPRPRGVPRRRAVHVRCVHRQRRRRSAPRARDVRGGLLLGCVAPARDASEGECGEREWRRVKERARGHAWERRSPARACGNLRY